MKKYRLNVAFDDYQVGHVFEANETSTIRIDGFYSGPTDIAHMLHTGFLSEVVDEVWPVEYDSYWYIDGEEVESDLWEDHIVDRTRRDGLGIYKTKEEAEAMFEKLKAVAKNNNYDSPEAIT